MLTRIISFGLAGLCPAAALVSCTPIPVAMPHAVVAQTKLDAADHWRVMAEDLASAVRLNFAPGDRPIYVARKAPFSAFDAAFDTYLTTALLNRGFSFSPNPTGALVLDHAVQPVQFAWRDPQYWFFDARPTSTDLIVTATVTADGRQVLRDTRTYYVNDGDLQQYDEAYVTGGVPQETHPVRVNVVAK